MQLILPHLYLGDFNDSTNPLTLSNNKINAIITLAYELAPCDPFTKARCYKFPWDDSLSFDIYSQLDDVTKLIHTLRTGRLNVLVHCHMGISRSTSAIVAYLIRYFNMTRDHALAYVKSKRSIVKPNSSFMKQLHAYEHTTHYTRGGGQ